MTALSRRPWLLAAFNVGLLGAAIFVIAPIIWQGFIARGSRTRRSRERAVFPTYETMVAQLLAAILVVGSYYAATHMQRGVRGNSSKLANAPASVLVFVNGFVPPSAGNR
jgi:hypothetical protein